MSRAAQIPSIDQEPTMTTRSSIIVLLLLALFAGLLLSATGCNTWKGAGKDVEKTGDAMQGK
jgi:predicted small secreted protein